MGRHPDRATPRSVCTYRAPRECECAALPEILVHVACLRPVTHWHRIGTRGWQRTWSFLALPNAGSSSGCPSDARANAEFLSCGQSRRRAGVSKPVDPGMGSTCSMT
jgi:hypothetical protein